MYKNVGEEQSKQHHRNKGTSLKNMTKAQKQAWEFLSGSETFDCYNDSNPKYKKHVVIRMEIAGKGFTEKSAKWFQKEYFQCGFKIIKLKKSYQNITNQVRGFNILKEWILDNEKPIDVVKLTIQENEGVQKSLAESFLSDFGSFSDMMAIGYIVDLEEDIIRMEWNKSVGKKDEYDDYDGKVKEYVEYRKKAKEKYKDKFEELVMNSKKTHNECARSNLDNSNGKMFCFVLPLFKDDGTHEQLGKKDMPWS